MEFYTKFKKASPLIKVAITWTSWATICLTGYYFARLWAGNQKIENLKIKQNFNNEFIEKMELARSKMEHEQKLTEATTATGK